MRFLADAGISPKTVDFLRRAAHDVLHVRELAMQRASDRIVADRARSDERVLLTFDLDFGAILAFGVVDRPSVVIFRLPTNGPIPLTAVSRLYFPRTLMRFSRERCC